MSPLDWILSVIGLAGFIAFVGVIASFVPERDLLIVIGIAVAMAVFDFWIRPFLVRRPQGAPNRSTSLL
ncbi:hypothetical protein L1787_21215 [Acuticoccus sp. M5D2P5]|uniref:hypothetical protein n=1 Tax=Acuticoccus kalidii TaxID=2910977 RepID=UPI001F46D58C|nr:hypothetical protein [Acuticoccus kalidii]MCF3935913.1 hypothetical protein [Acuticoccus kalidii]